MKSFEYKNGVYTPNEGVNLFVFVKDIIEDLQNKGIHESRFVFNDTNLNVFADSNHTDIYEKYYHARAYLRLKQEMEYQYGNY